MPVASRYEPLDLPETDLFSFLFCDKDRRYPDEKVIFQDSIDSSRRYSFADLKTSVIALSEGLKSEFGIKKGDVIAVVSQNDVDTPVAIYGAIRSGAVVTPANPAYTADELAFQLVDSGASLVITHLSSLTLVRDACLKAGVDKSRIVLQGPVTHRLDEPRHWRNIKANGSHTQQSSEMVDPKHDLAYLVYSSGTTGRPKGVRLTHYNVTSNILQGDAGEGEMVSWDGSKGSERFPGPSDGDKQIACLPFYHIYGLTLLIAIPIYQGVLSLVMPRFNLERWCQLVQEHKVSLGFIVPPIAVLLAKHPCVTNFDLSSLRMTTSGAAPLSRALVDACYQRTGVRIKQGYGLSETSPVLCSQKWQDWQTKSGAVGLLVPNLEAKFCTTIDTDTSPSNAEEVATGEIGELYVRGPNIFAGYHNNSEATRTCLDSDGWFRTGDIGFLDEEGNLFITDRAKELIKYKGFQVPPAELEGHLLEHELVDDAVVVGVQSQRLTTEVPLAYVVRKGGSSAASPGEELDIMRWLDSRVAPHKRLKGGLKFIDSIPKSASGKILRRYIRDQAQREYSSIEMASRDTRL